MTYRDRNGITGPIGGITNNQAQPPPAPAPATPTPQAYPMTTLTVGRYWITGFGDKATQITAYLATTNAAGSTRVEVTEAINATTDNSPGQFWIFNVLKPVGWFATLWGKPSIAGPNVHSAADTANVPDPPTPLSTLDDFLGSMLTGNIGKMVLAGVIVYALTEGLKSK
jgi:hypothetical protein